MGESLFVGRESELNTIDTTASTDNSESLVAVRGPSGIGKTRLLREFVQQNREEESRVLKYDLKEPASAEQFFSRLLDHWKDIHPSAVSAARSDGIAGWAESIGSSLEGSSSTAFSLIGSTLEEAAGSQETADRSDITSDILELAVETRDHSSTGRFVIVIDQLDKNRIDESVYESLISILREIATDAPEGISCCVGTRERFYEMSNSDIRDVELDAIDIEDVQMYLDGRDLDSTEAKSVHEAAGGTPYFVERIGRIAEREGGLESVLGDLSNVQEERRRMLEERFLDTLDDSSLRLLNKTCFLPELRAQPVAHVLGEEPETVRRTLQRLEEQSVVTRLGYSRGNPVYRLHGLQRDFLRNRLTGQGRIIQHACAAAYYAQELDRIPTGDMKALLTKEGTERHRKFLTAGVMFEYHVQQLPRHLNAEDRMEHVFNRVSGETQSVKQSVRTYFTSYREYSATPEMLGVTPAVDPDKISNAVDNEPETTSRSGVPTASVVRGLRAEGKINDDQTEVLIALGQAMKRFADVENTNRDVQPPPGGFRSMRSQLTDDQFPNAPELCRLGRVLFVVFDELSQPESGFEGAWPVLEEEYGITQDTYSALSKAVLITASILFDSEIMDVLDTASGGEGSMATLDIEEDRSVEEEGVERSVLNCLVSPLLIGPQVFSSPTPEDLDRLYELWSEQEAKFEERDQPLVAAVCRDMQAIVIDPISPDDPSTALAQKVSDELESSDPATLDQEPVATLETVFRSFRGVAAKDPQRKN
jgi:hypothetical protein